MQYNPQKERVPGELVMVGPVYPGGGENKSDNYFFICKTNELAILFIFAYFPRFTILPDKKEGVPQVSGPVYPVNQVIYYF